MSRHQQTEEIGPRHNWLIRLLKLSQVREDRAGGWAYSKASPPSRWDPLMSVLGGQKPENIIGNSGPYHLEIENHACRTMGKCCTKTGLFVLATLLTVDADARTHDQHMVLPNAPHQMRSMSIHGQHPSQRDAKVRNRHRKPLETGDLLRSESLLGILNCTTSSRGESIDLGQHRSPSYPKTGREAFTLDDDRRPWDVGSANS